MKKNSAVKKGQQPTPPMREATISNVVSWVGYYANVDLRTGKLDEDNQGRGKTKQRNREDVTKETNQ